MSTLFRPADLPVYEKLMEGLYPHPLSLVDFREFLFRRGGPKAAWKLDFIMAVRSWEEQWKVLSFLEPQIGQSATIKDASNQRQDTLTIVTPLSARDRTMENKSYENISIESNSSNQSNHINKAVQPSRAPRPASIAASSPSLLPSPPQSPQYPMPTLTPLAVNETHEREQMQGTQIPPILRKAAASIAVHFLFSDSPMALPFPIPNAVLTPALELIFKDGKLAPDTFQAIKLFVEENLEHEQNAGWNGFVRNVEGNMIDMLGGGYKLPWRPFANKDHQGANKPNLWTTLYWLRFNLIALSTLIMGFVFFIVILVVKSTQNKSRTFLLLLWPAATLTAYSYLQLDRSVSMYLYFRNQRQRVIVDAEKWQHVTSVVEERVEYPIRSLHAHNLYRAIFFSIVTGIVLTMLFVPLWPDDVTNPSKFVLNIT